jgi:surface antigen
MATEPLTRFEPLDTFENIANVFGALMHPQSTCSVGERIAWKMVSLEHEALKQAVDAMCEAEWENTEYGPMGPVIAAIDGLTDRLRVAEAALARFVILSGIQSPHDKGTPSTTINN